MATNDTYYEAHFGQTLPHSTLLINLGPFPPERFRFFLERDMGTWLGYIEGQKAMSASIHERWPVDGTPEKINAWRTWLLQYDDLRARQYIPQDIQASQLSIVNGLG